MKVELYWYGQILHFITLAQKASFTEVKKPSRIIQVLEALHFAEPANAIAMMLKSHFLTNLFPHHVSIYKRLMD